MLFSEFLQGWQTWPPVLNTQKFLVYEISHFFVFFSAKTEYVFFQLIVKNLNLKFKKKSFCL